MASPDLSALLNLGGPSVTGPSGGGNSIGGLGAGLAGAGLAAATGGISPLLLSALMHFGPSILSGILGNKADPNQQLRKQLMALIAAQPGLAAQLYQQQVASPGYSAAQGDIATGANQASNQVAGSLAARGIGTSGTGAVLSGLTPSLVGSQMAKLHATAQENANQQAQNMTQQQISALSGTSGPSQTRQLFAGGLESFAPVFENWLKQRFPGFQGAPAPAR